MLAVILINLYTLSIKNTLNKHPEIKVPYVKENHLLASVYPNNLIINCFINDTIRKRYHKSQMKYNIYELSF
jgi:hypothetical protein